MDLEIMSGYHIAHLDDRKPGEILREQRVTQNLTQQQVASKAKITLQQYQKFENSSRNIRTASFQLACRVLEALNMDITAFFHGDYSIGEEVYAEGGNLKFKKTGRGINEDVTKTN